MHQVGLSLVNVTACRAQWEPTLIREANICSHAAGSSSCLVGPKPSTRSALQSPLSLCPQCHLLLIWQGDPAAPLFCRKNGAYLLFGILSFGSKTCGDDKPAVFTKVSDFESRIRDVMGGT